MHHFHDSKCRIPLAIETPSEAYTAPQFMTSIRRIYFANDMVRSPISKPISYVTVDDYGPIRQNETCKSFGSEEHSRKD